MKLRIDPERLKRASTLGGQASRGRVLVVDDEEENLFALAGLLRARWHVDATTDVEEALKIAAGPVDLVVTDQRMPAMLGTELLARIKAINPDNVRMILTGYTDARDLITCINDGLIDRYLVKPWRAEELEGALDLGMERLRLQRTVAKLVPDQVIARLYGGRLGDARPGDGREMECAILFLDIRGFTAISERIGATGAFELLTRYFSAVAPRIREHHGFIDKYLGDGLLAIFDRPAQFGADAVACARELVRGTSAYNAELGMAEPLAIGIGVAAGRVMLGTVGFPGRLEFTVLGDAVNVASRLQELTKTHGVPIIVQTALAAGFTGKELGEIRLRGRNEAVQVTAVDPG
jgi:class 3 adenylate cyclase